MSEKRVKVYLDYNIYDGLAKNEIKMINKLDNVRFYLSTTHVEEYYRAVKFCDVCNKQQLALTRECIDKYSTKGCILNPSKRKIVIKQESLDDCYKRIAKDDTVDEMILNAQNNDERYKRIVELLKKNDLTVMNYSNLTEKEIFERPEVKEVLNLFREYVKYRNSSIAEMFAASKYDLWACEDMYRLEPFDLKFNICREKELSYIQLECTVEVLNDILCCVGYNKDKKLRKTNSGIYDVTHAIYGTYCDYFVTLDKRFLKRIKAIYYYLGIKTKCVTWEEFQQLM